MKFVFQKHYVAAGGKGFVIGAELPDGVLSKEQIDRLVADGILSQVFGMESFFDSEVVVSEEVEFSEVEQLDPEKAVRKPKRK